jgi:hypothetical protein
MGDCSGHKRSLVSGDISPAYSKVSDEIIQRVVNSFPNLEVIFLARDPLRERGHNCQWAFVSE